MSRSAIRSRRAPLPTLRITAQASELPEPERYCTRCEQPLKGKFAWLEHDRRFGGYHDLGGVPQEHSQGLFPFGLSCARGLVKEAQKELALIGARS